MDTLEDFIFVFGQHNFSSRQADQVTEAIKKHHPNIEEVFKIIEEYFQGQEIEEIYNLYY